ncbi:MAG: ABC transporter ATP-binding protein/permease [Alphaproteobacteria bacterium]|nr:ABC transporter ATP-binding protein/permease [Alphaproteobacteria bacterium]MCL2505214.1 ABC transporter ATP-binding protein/permease [Alphaproteobacteria bacterium]
MVKNYSHIWPYVRPYWFRALIAVLITIPVGSMDAVIAWSLKPFMDTVMLQSEDFNMSTAWIPLLIIGFSFTQSMLNYCATYLNTWVGNRIAIDLKQTLFHKLMTYHAAFFDKRNSGEIAFRFNNDVDAACSGLLSNVKLFTTRLFASISLIAVLFWNSWQLAIVAVTILFIALFPLTKVRKKIKEIMDKTVSTGGFIVTHYNETFSGNRTISSYNLHDYQGEKFDNTLKTLFKLSMKMTRKTGMLSPMMHFIVSLGIALVIWLGTYLIVNQQITPGNFVSFLAALIMLYQPVKTMGNNFTAIQMSLLAMERVFSLLDDVPAIKDKEGAVPLDCVNSTIEYKDVVFEYEQGRPVLKGVSLKINVGQTVALVGNSGGGKTTMANILPRFYDIKGGSITIDGTDIRDVTLKSLRNNIAVVFQDNFLFSGTMRENILLGKHDATEKELTQAVEAACLSEFVASLPLGLDTVIGERGVLLSGGQKQRVAIARAFLKNAPIVVLDEATSALDNKSEAVVQAAIDNLMKDKTVIVIAHRLSTIRNADKIAVVNHGEIVETGTHDELIRKRGSVYSSLYNAQVN